MYRVINAGKTVFIGFDNKAEYLKCWEDLRLFKHKKVQGSMCGGDENMINSDYMDYPLHALDYFAISVNCMAFLEMPKSVFEKYKAYFGQ